MRIFRTLIVLTGAALLMPSPPDEAARLPAGEAEAVSALNVISGATSAVADVASFCSRQPAVCETAGYVAAKLEAKAKYNFRLLYEWAQDGDRQGQAAASDPMATGSNDRASKHRPMVSQSTLRLDDLIPEWRGPKSKKG